MVYGMRTVNGGIGKLQAAGWWKRNYDDANALRVEISVARSVAAVTAPGSG